MSNTEYCDGQSLTPGCITMYKLMGSYVTLLRSHQCYWDDSVLGHTARCAVGYEAPVAAFTKAGTCGYSSPLKRQILSRTARSPSAQRRAGVS